MIALNALAFLLGISIFQCLPDLPQFKWIFILIGILCLLIFFRTPKTLSLIIIGFLWAFIQASLLLSQRLPLEIENEDLPISGTIVSIPTKDHHRVQFLMDPENIFLKEKIWKPNLIKLSWYHTPLLDLRVGDKYQLTVRLKRPRGFMNPGGFDYEKWLFHQKIQAVGYVRPKGDNHFIISPKSAYPIDRTRQVLLEKLDHTLIDDPYKGIIQALTLGETNHITSEQWQVFQRTGTIHLVAISGLHIGLLAGLVYFLGKYLWSLRPTWLLIFPAQSVAAMSALVAAFIYAALAGFSIPTQRALIMVALVMLGLLIRRPISIIRTLSIALFLILIWDPLAVLTSGFWLSFGAVSLLVFGIHRPLMKTKPTMNSPIFNAIYQFWRWGHAQWVVTLGLMPLLIYQFQKFSLISPIANLIAIPWMEFFIVPLLLLGVLLLAPFPILGKTLLTIGSYLFTPLWYFLIWCSHFSLAQWTLIAPTLGTLLLAILGILLILVPKGIPGRWLGIIGIIPLLTPSQKQIEYGSLQFTLLDVGQGLASVVSTQSHTLVFDTGPKYSEKFNAGDGIIAPFLYNQGIQQIDTLIISHGDNDHAGGMVRLLQRIPAKKILTGTPSEFSEINIRSCVQGQHWHWDGVGFEILHPQIQSSYQGNNQSCVLQITIGSQYILLTGDIGKLIEQKLISQYKDKLATTILVAPHHGSASSSSLEFIAATHPKYVLFPVGYQNQWHFPKPEVVQRYLNQDAEIWDTAYYGAITIHMTADTIKKPESFRQTYGHYWTEN
ncbi:DNA internalization-related competence protein ComEC/Rec2 [Candidatus Nitrosacidococcus tergens]|uniref:DNA internalization-related competence protein ComEC/Rec2 n=1 Tax=Candidatus Nitrosacidococcus tergens TaxID=553981 RepID=A0A7G1QB50_9GAMM|nr:DNA internalization-related competence protein ComEC/Rec2 [Candidatus Nitrosacidococcus tergens]CAB1277145.1 DNA internalization-related competence protein ComEC/Rec2 [Candidatus Nitrosacidococcus tergens]